MGGAAPEAPAQEQRMRKNRTGVPQRGGGCASILLVRPERFQQEFSLSVLFHSGFDGKSGDECTDSSYAFVFEPRLIRADLHLDALGAGDFLEH